jgi:very-short-patch-repair endonuclease
MTTNLDLPRDLFTRADLDVLQVSDGQLRRAIRDRQVRVVIRGVFVRYDVPDSLELRLEAVAHHLAPGQVVCDRTAAWLHGVDMFSQAEKVLVPRVESAVMPGRRASKAAEVRGRNRSLLKRDIGELNGLRVTTPLRTALDLACNLHRKDGLAALDVFARLHGIRVEQLERELPRFRRRRGVIQARALVRLMDSRAESVRESWVRLTLVEAGLPLPDLQVWVDRNGVPTYRLDLAYPASRVAIEYDGEPFHRSQESRAHDRQRREWLREQGWTLIIVRNGDFSSPALETWIGRVRDALESSYCNLRW